MAITMITIGLNGNNVAVLPFIKQMSIMLSQSLALDFPKVNMT